MKTILTPAVPETCPGNPNLCDECDYLLCCVEGCGACKAEKEICPRLQGIEK